MCIDFRFFFIIIPILPSTMLSFLFTDNRLSLSLLYKLINKGHVEADKTINTEEDADLFRNTPLFKKTKIKPKTLPWNLTITLQQNLKGQLAGGKWMAQLIVP